MRINWQGNLVWITGKEPMEFTTDEDARKAYSLLCDYGVLAEDAVKKAEKLGMQVWYGG